MKSVLGKFRGIHKTFSECQLLVTLFLYFISHSVSLELLKRQKPKMSYLRARSHTVGNRASFETLNSWVLILDNWKLEITRNWKNYLQIFSERPRTPSKLMLIGEVSDHFIVEWLPVPDATSYELMIRSLFGNRTIFCGRTTIATCEDILPGVIYDVWVRSVRDGVKSHPSEVLKVVSDRSLDEIAQPPPNNLKVRYNILFGGAEAVISWDDIYLEIYPNILQYELQVTGDFTDGSCVKTFLTESAMSSVKHINSRKEYSARVRVNVDEVTSDWSDRLKFQRLASNDARSRWSCRYHTNLRLEKKTKWNIFMQMRQFFRWIFHASWIFTCIETFCFSSDKENAFFFTHKKTKNSNRMNKVVHFFVNIKPLHFETIKKVFGWHTCRSISVCLSVFLAVCCCLIAKSQKKMWNNEKENICGGNQGDERVTSCQHKDLFSIQNDNTSSIVNKIARLPVKHWTFSRKLFNSHKYLRKLFTIQNKIKITNFLGRIAMRADLHRKVFVELNSKFPPTRFPWQGHFHDTCT